MDLTWKRSTRCSSNGCVEVAWTRSSFCANGACVEVGHEDGRVLLRDSKLLEESPVIGFTPSGWRGFVSAAAEWDRESDVTISGVWLRRRGELVDHPLCVSDDQLRHLHFSWEEWNAFLAGIEAREFTVEALSRG